MNYEILHLKLALRRVLLKQRDFSMGRGTLLNRFPAVPLEVFDATVAECTREGLITSKPGKRETVIYTWHEEAVAESAL